MPQDIIFVLYNQYLPTHIFTLSHTLHSFISLLLVRIIFLLPEELPLVFILMQYLSQNVCIFPSFFEQYFFKTVLQEAGFCLLLFFNLFYLFFWPRHAACGILVPRPGIKPVCPLQWKCGVFNHWTAREVPEQYFC